MGLIKTTIIVAITAVVLVFLFEPEVPITAKTVILGTKGYDMKPVTAPSADGVLLQVLTYIITRTPIGHAIRRKLLNDNDIHMVRELGAQVEIPPLYFPMRRVGPDYFDDAPRADIHQIVENGVASSGNPLREDFRAQGGFAPRTIMEYAHAYKSGTHKPSDVMKKALSAVHAWEKDGFNIFSSLKDEDVMQQARESDARHASGKPLSVLDGVPIAFKDSLEIVGHNTYNGYNPNPVYQEYWYAKNSTRDDIMVARFRAMGAIIFGLTIMVEGGVSPLGYNSHFQGPFNPYSWNRYSGGSSSGSAVAVATGIVPVAIGFDGGGSVRIPSAMSGVHGLATTYGRVPFEKDFSGQMIKSGPLTASSEDVMIAMSVLADTDLNHFYSKLYDGGIQGPPTFTLYDDSVKGVKGMRVGIYREWFNDAAPKVKARCNEVLNFLKKQGVEVVDIDIPHLQAQSLAHGIKLSSEMAQSWEKIYFNAPTR